MQIDIDAIFRHATEPSTVRGIVWTIGAGLALVWIHAEDYRGALEVLTQAGLVAGAVGMLSKDRCTECPDKDGGE